MKMKISDICAISFDGDGTLWDFDTVMRHSLWCTLEELKKIDFDAAARLDIETMITIRDTVAAKLKGKTTNLEEVRLEAFKQTLKDIGNPNDDLANHLNQVYLSHRFEDIALFDDVLPVLHVLQTKFTLGLLSNGNSYPEKCGLQNMFEFVVFSQDYEVEKPDPEIFQIAAKKAGCLPYQLLHVGNSIQEDVMGALAAGVPCIWLNRDKKKPDMNLPIEYEIEFLLELLEILEC